MAIEYLDPSIANEGESANNWQPGSWTNAPAEGDTEYQPDIDPPRIPDYAALKEHKHYKKYFRPHVYRPFPAWMYHATQEPRIVKTKEEVVALGPEWRTEPFVKDKPMVMVGKALPGKSEQAKLTEAIAGAMQQMASRPAAGGAIDPQMIAAVVAGVIAALPQHGAAPPMPSAAPAPVPAAVAHPLTRPEGAPVLDDHVVDPQDGIERQAMLELAEKEGIKVDKRWSNARIKEALGID